MIKRESLTTLFAFLPPSLLNNTHDTQILRIRIPHLDSLICIHIHTPHPIHILIIHSQQQLNILIIILRRNHSSWLLGYHFLFHHRHRIGFQWVGWLVSRRNE
ncbi:hypothetical protein R3P38DRAFT_2827072 [Favolaschia claudopus]|uniref:Uncharacterized protein n=1 Tax=Favolaschia claudopus TaxID=2862362 RepID=A0AAW0EKQ1_9AGAR